MIKKILVTGSLGQIGSYLCEDLIQNNIEVLGLDNETNKCPNLPEIASKVTVKGDIRDKVLVNKILKKVDAVVHCAAQVSVEGSLKNPMDDAENNILGTVTLLQAATEASSVKRFVYLSSAATYGNTIDLPINENHPQNPLSPYGLSKLAGERYVSIFWRMYKLPTVIIRPFNFYSNRVDPKSPYSGVITKFIERVKANKPPMIEGDGKQTRDFIHVKDVIQLIRITLEKEEAIGEIFNCGSGKPTTVNQLADIVINISEKNLKSVYVEERKGDIKHSYADIKKANKILKFEPKIELKEGLEEIINY